MKKHTIRFKDNIYPSYDILIGQDLLPMVLDYVKKHISPGKQAIIADGNVVKAGYLKQLDPTGKVPKYIVKPDKNGGVESRKNATNLGKMVDFLDGDFEKTDTAVAFGGGMTGDTVGVVANGYKRGKMFYIQVPTTPLSQADSSVGGKCAIDGEKSKNSFGCFYQPHLVVADVNTLATVSEEHYRSGLVESVKHGIILDKAYFEFLEREMPNILKRDKEVLEMIAFKNVQLKGGVVGRDPLEKNERRRLNFGHTIGHAVEIVSGFTIPHGKAVALGGLSALYLSHSNGTLSTKDFDRAQDLLVNGLGMPDKVPSGISWDEVLKRLPSDKKVIGGVPRFVTVDGIGKTHVENGQFASPISNKALKGAMGYIFN
ncbi:3-dehydroquinate synthase family protein [Nanoarchaeota archaeon]